MKSSWLGRLATLVAITLAVWMYQGGDFGVAAADRFSGPTSSQPLALSADDALLLVANPDNNSVTLFDVRPGYNTALIEVTVGTEPNGVALNPQGTRGYVANTVSGTVTVLEVNTASSFVARVLTTIPVGTEPYGVALTPAGSKLYVTNARSNSVSVINTATNQVIKTITDVGIEPRGIAITNGGAADTLETVYVTQFLALPVPASGILDGADDAKSGFVTIISAATDTVTDQVTLNPLADTGFKAAGDALRHIAPPATPTTDDFKFVTGAYPNQLNNLAIRGGFAFVPNTGASPNGPVRFNVNTQSLLSVIDRTAKADAGKTINMHRAVAQQTNTNKRFITQPWAMAFKHAADEGYIVSAASNIVVKVAIAANGTPTVQNDPTDSGRVLEIPTGKNPRGIVVNSADTRAYVMNYVSRDVTVIDLSGNEQVSATLLSANLPEPGSPEDIIQIGKELYNTSIGEFDAPAEGQAGITGRMSAAGWGSCASCHPFGLSDNVVWLFGSGPRRTVPQHADFPPGGAVDLSRALNWSAIFDEEEDFEANIRGVSGGQGLIVQADGVSQDTTLAAFTPANANRNQLKVRGIGAWDAIKRFVQSGIRAPISPLSAADADVVAGRNVFIQSNCQSCHGGSQWTTGQLPFVPPPDASQISSGQLVALLRDVGTFDATAANEVRATGAPSLGVAGFNAPTLMSLFAFPQTFLHNGSLSSLDQMLQNVPHRIAGTGTDYLIDSNARAQLIQFLLSIDGSTEPIARNAPGQVSTVPADSYTPESPLAAEAIVSAFGSSLAVGTGFASTIPLPVALAGTTIGVLDSAGVERLAPLFYISPVQINYQVPAGTATGHATITVTSNSGIVSVGTATIEDVVPGLFTANADGKGVPAATAIRVAADGTQTPVNVFGCDTTGKNCVPTPIDLGAETDRVFITLYGTGIRNRTDLANVQCVIGGENATMAFAGDQGAFQGLDQVNVELPSTLRGRGEVNLVLTVDGKAANTVAINVR